MLLGARQFFAARRAAPTPPSIPYVATGLKGFWDGEWNAGIGIHSDSPENIADLVGSSPLSFSAGLQGVTIGDKWFQPVSSRVQNTGTTIAKDAIAAKAFTMEVCCECVTQKDLSSTIACGARGSTARFLSTNSLVANRAQILGTTTDIDGPSLGTLSTLVMRIDGSSASYFLDGSFNASLGIGEQTATNGIELGLNSTGNWKFFSARIYDRALTDGEIAANAAVDANRFR